MGREISELKQQQLDDIERRGKLLAGTAGLVLGMLGTFLAMDDGDPAPVRVNPSDCVTHVMQQDELAGFAAESIAEELEFNPSLRFTGAIHDTLDRQGYGRFEVCVADDGRPVITDLDGN